MEPRADRCRCGATPQCGLAPSQAGGVRALARVVGESFERGRLMKGGGNTDAKGDPHLSTN